VSYNPAVPTLRSALPEAVPLMPALRARVVRAAGLWLAALLAACSDPASVDEFRLARADLARDMNVLLVTLDTTRADRLGCYGHDGAQTPVLDGLARRGIRFDQAVAPTPMTLPSHTSLFTGLYPPSHGVRDNGRARAGEALSTLPETLADNGFATAAFVGAFVLDSRFGLDQGFAHYDDELPARAGGERAGAEVIERATAWLEDVESGQRLFCWVHLFEPHSPHRPPPPFDVAFGDRPYDGEVAAVDALVGELLTTLEAKGIAERTLVVVAGDHGEAFGEHGEQGHAVFVYDTTLRVPLIMAWPEALPGGVVVEQPVSLVDVAPTILDLLGIDPPSGAEGRSLLDLCFDPDRATDERPLYAESLHGRMRFGWSPLHAIRTTRWKYIRAPRPELYDLQADPGETTNVVDAHPDVVASLAAALDAMDVDVEVDTESVELDPDAVAALEALGYVGGESLAAANADPKDRIRALVAYQQAKEWLASGRPADALPLLEGLARESPGAAEIHQQLGLAHARLELWDEAAASLRRALALDPDGVEALVNLAAVYMAVDDLVRARPLLEHALDLDPDNALAHLNMGSLAIRLGDLRTGVDHHARFLQIAPEDPRADAVRRSISTLREQLGDG